MHPRPYEIKPKSEKKNCDVNLTKTATVEKGKSPIFDVEISGGWSIKSKRKYQIVDQIFHISVLSCLIILACYIISIHSVLYYETQDTAHLKNQVKYAFTLNTHLSNVIQSLKFSLDNVKKDLDNLRSELEMKSGCSCEKNHVRQRRSNTDENKDSVSNHTQKKNKRNRTKAIEPLAVHFESANPDAYGHNHMQGRLGPWWIKPVIARTREPRDNFGLSFKFDDRYVEIARAGLYFIYSQVTYQSEGRPISYSINKITRSNVTGKEISNKAVAQCNAVGPVHLEFDVSCHTSTIQLLYPKDIVYLQQISTNVSVYFDIDMTYWGLILLSEM